MEVRDGQSSYTGRTKDVSRHGFFLVTQAPLKERFLVQLVLHLPTGPLSATGFVVRLQEPQGAGIQFFALSAAAKSHWDHFITGATPPPALDHDEHPERATFLVKLRDQARLQEFAERNFKKGGLYMATPLLKEEGAPVTLVVVHPDSENEFLIDGEVARVCREPPKGMDVRFAAPDAEQLEAFSVFVHTGAEPVAPEPVSPSRPHRAAKAPEPSADFSIDIELDSIALDESARFSWDDVSDYRMVLDFELTSGAEGGTGPVAVPMPAEAADDPRPWGEKVGLSSDGAATIEAEAPAELAALAVPSGDLPLPSEVPGGSGGISIDLLPGPQIPDAPASARNRWTWSTPPKGVDPVTPPAAGGYGEPPARFPPPRAPSAKPGPPPMTSTAPQVLDLGLVETGDVAPVAPPGPPPPPPASVDVAPAPEPDLLIPMLEPVDAEPPVSDFEQTPDLAAVSAAEEVARLLDAELSARPSTADVGRAPLQSGDIADVQTQPWMRWVRDEAIAQHRVHVRCGHCEADFGQVTLGHADGALALVAEHRPYWNPDLQKLVSVVRLRAGEDRAAVARALAASGGEVPVSVVFDVANLGRPPADPTTGARVRVNSIVKALTRLQEELRNSEQPKVALGKSLCPKCKEAELFAERC